jgi:integration host factor subunit beta
MGDHATGDVQDHPSHPFLALSTRRSAMTKADLVQQISEKTKISKTETAVIVKELLGSISRALSEGKHIEIRGFGSFKVRSRNPRKARNPRSGETVMVPAKAVPYFKASADLRAMVDQALSGTILASESDERPM